jgi:hypothetical protein
VQENEMMESTFTIEFPEHLAQAKLEYCLARLVESGSTLEHESERVFRIICSTPAQMRDVGWSLFHTHLADLCRVIGTTGKAEARASAYSLPQNRKR